MSKKIPVSGIGDHYKKNYAKFLNAFILIADGKIKEGTPVDTGRMRIVGKSLRVVLSLEMLMRVSTETLSQMRIS